MLRAEPSPTDSKTSVTHLYAFQLLDDEDDSTVYAIPVEYKNLKHHDQLFSMPAAAAAKRTELKPRWKTRAFKVLLPANLAKLYVDDVGNPVFNGTVMDELDNDGHQPMLPSSASTNVADLQVAPLLVHSHPS